MAFCPNCGAQTAGTFCSNCGTSLGTAANPPGYTGSTASGMSDNVAAALCYIPFLIGLIVDIVLLVVAPYNRNRNIRFHAFQSLFLHAALFVLSIAFSMLLGVLSLATHGLGALAGIGLYPIFFLCVIALFIYLMYQAYNNRKIMLPVIGELANKQA